VSNLLPAPGLPTSGEEVAWLFVVPATGTPRGRDGRATSKLHPAREDFYL
jgi:hypothetical protein